MAVRWQDLHASARQDLAAALERGISATQLALAVAARARGEEAGPAVAAATAEVDRLAWLLGGRLAVVDPSGQVAVREALSTAARIGDFEPVLDIANACEEADQSASRRLDVQDRVAHYYDRALRFWEQGDLLSAAADATSALNHSPDEVHILSNRGAWMYQLGFPWAAVEDWQRAVCVDPRYANGWMKLGTVLAELGNQLPARAAFQKALEVAPAGWPYQAAVTAEVARLGANEG